MYPTTELAPNLPVERLVAIYADAEARIVRAFAEVDGALTTLGAAFEDGGRSMSLRGRWGKRNDCDWGAPGDTLRELRRQVWSHLIERLQVRRVMSVKAWDEFAHKMEHDEPPEITVENVRGMVAHFRAEAPSMLEDAVKEVFDWLRPTGYMAAYKTNTQFEIGERVILGYVVEPWCSRWHVIYTKEQKLMALENVFRMLDGGKRRDETGLHLSDLSAAIQSCTGDRCVGETEYFAFRGHRNHNLHLRFKRCDLVARLNAVAGGMRLKPEAAKNADDRRPRPPAEVDNLEDTAHQELGPSRPARALR